MWESEEANLKAEGMPITFEKVSEFLPRHYANCCLQKMQDNNVMSSSKLRVPLSM